MQWEPAALRARPIPRTRTTWTAAARALRGGESANWSRVRLIGELGRLSNARVTDPTTSWARGRRLENAGRRVASAGFKQGRAGECRSRCKRCVYVHYGLS